MVNNQEFTDRNLSQNWQRKEYNGFEIVELIKPPFWYPKSNFVVSDQSPIWVADTSQLKLDGSIDLAYELRGLDQPALFRDRSLIGLGKPPDSMDRHIPIYYGVSSKQQPGFVGMTGDINTATSLPLIAAYRAMFLGCEPKQAYGFNGYYTPDQAGQNAKGLSLIQVNDFDPQNFSQLQTNPLLFLDLPIYEPRLLPVQLPICFQYEFDIMNSTMTLYEESEKNGFEATLDLIIQMNLAISTIKELICRAELDCNLWLGLHYGENLTLYTDKDITTIIQSLLLNQVYQLPWIKTRMHTISTIHQNACLQPIQFDCDFPVHILTSAGQSSPKTPIELLYPSNDIE